MEENEGSEIINEGLHDPYELGDPLCDNIYSVEDEVSSMARIVDGGMLPIFLPTSSIKEEKIEWEKVMKGHEN